VVTQAVGLLNPDWTNKVKTIFSGPARYLDEKHTALLPRTKELVTLGLIRLAADDPAAAAEQIGKLRWRTQLTQEERSYVWGVIGKRAAQRLSDDAPAYFANAQDKYLHPDHLEWKVRAALRAASSSPASSPARLQALAAAEEFTARLEKLFFDLALHKTVPDMTAREALLYLQQACDKAPELLSLSGRAGASAEIRGLSAGALKSLAVSRTAAGASPGDFPQKLKVCSIYSGLDAIFDPYERCADALYSSTP